MDTVKRLVAGITKVPGLRLVAEPDMTLIAFESHDAQVDILAVADALEENGWHMERQQRPNCLHLTVMPPHAKVCDKFLEDLATAVETVRADQRRAHAGTAAMYGMLAQLPEGAGVVDQFIVRFLGQVYTA